MEETIREGDLVDVSWENLESLRGRVLYIPEVTGDCWHIRCEIQGAKFDGELFYVQSFAMMHKLKEDSRDG